MKKGDKINVVNVLGGLGNQLFQYVFGMYLNKLTGLETRYDFSDLSAYGVHGGVRFDSFFDAKLCDASTIDGVFLQWIRRFPISKRLLYRYSQHAPFACPLWTDFNLGKIDRRPLKNVNLFYGYWQNIDYQDLLSSFRPEFRFLPTIAAAGKALALRYGIDFRRDVGVHVRRGDFLLKTHACHLALDEAQYYLPLIEKVARVNDGARFFVFSDDPVGLRGGPLDCSNSVIVHCDDADAAGIELYILSRFDKLIMSASTFSWWAAALGESGSRKIYCPTPWVKSDFVDRSELSPVPFSNWTLVQSR